jgi:hydroxylamine reductase (hybrid-cluster protein)
VKDYYPEIEILRHFDKPKTFFGYTNTNYTIDTTTFSKETDNNIIYFLQNCICNTQYYFDDFYTIDSETGEIEQYSDFLELTNYK